MTVFEKLAKVQKELKAPKGQFNSFGKYYYRSCEDILEAAKPLCIENELVLTITDDIIQVGERIYVRATATVSDILDGATVSSSAMAREAEEKKGMDASQITGASSSYARKYALGGLFALDDTKDSDATNDGKTTEKKAEPVLNKTESTTKKEPAKSKTAQTLAQKAEAAGIAEIVKDYSCTDCGKPFAAFTDKTGKTWNAGQVYHMSQSNNTDGKARCSECMKKAGTAKPKAKKE